MIQKQWREIPLRNQHLHKLDATHDLSKASTTKKHHKEALAILSCNYKQDGGLILSSTTPSKTLIPPLPYIHEGD